MRLLNSFDPDQCQHFVGPGQNTNNLQRSEWPLAV